MVMYNANSFVSDFFMGGIFVKNFFKNLLALTLSVVLISSSLATGFGVYAAAMVDSEAPYYDVDGKGIKSQNAQYPYHLKPVEQISNLDFENGFRFWAGGADTGKFAASVFNIETKGDNSYAKFPITGYVSSFQTALLKINNVTAGDQLVVVYDVKGADGDKIRIKVEQEYVKSIAVYDETTGLNTTTKADGVTLINVTPGVPRVLVGTAYEPSDFAANLTGNGWTTRVTPSSLTVAAPSTGTAYTGDPLVDGYFIKLIVTCGDAGVKAGDVIDAAIDNIRIATVKNGIYTSAVTGEVIYDPANPPEPPIEGGGDDGEEGGEEGGNETPDFEENPPKNLDFSDGFSGWTGETSKYSVVDGVLKTNDNYTAAWQWLKTEKFNIPNAVAGTTVKVTFDLKFEDDLVSMKDHADYQKYLSSTYGYKILDTYLYQYTASGNEISKKRKEVFYKDEGNVAVNSIAITDPTQEFEFWLSCGNSSKKTWEITNIIVTATHPDGTVETYPVQPKKPETSADTLVWLMNLILANDADDFTADFNEDNAVNLLDIVSLKKSLAKIELAKTPITAPMNATRTEDVYSSKIVRYELNSECKGYYFTPKEPGEYQTVIIMHGQGNVTRFKERLLSHFNEWVKAGYIEPMVVVLPEVLMSYAGSSSESDIEDFHNFIDSTKTNRFNALLTSIETGALSSKIDTSKKPFVAGFSMGGMAALSAGVEYRTRISQVGALSPATAFYLGEGQWGYCNYASDIMFSTDKDAHVYLSAGLAETNFTGGHTFVESINRFEQGIKVNNADILTKFTAPESWGNHAYPLAHKEIFMFLHLASYGRLPSVSLVESVCTNSEVYKVPTVVYTAADEHK